MTNSPSDGGGPAPKPRPELRAVETVPPPDAADGTPDADPGVAPDADPEAATPTRRAAKTAARITRRTTRQSKATAKAAGTPRGGKRATKPAAKAAAARRAPVRRAPAKKPATPRTRAASTRRAAPSPELDITLDAAPAAPEVRPARLQARHWIALLSFVLVVILPLAATVGYLYTRAADRYHSEVAFSIRSEEAGSAAAGLLGALTSIGSGSASDADILYEYVRSQGIVEAIDGDLDLRTIWGRAEGDPVFTIAPDASIEALVAHWRSMVEVAFESAAGIIHVRAQAFTPEEAQAIAQAILAESGALVNELSEQARDDAVRFAREELAEAEENLAAMRARLSEFRRVNRLVDPSGDVAGQTGLLNALQAELAQALVERDMLLTYADEGDQRVLQANRRITAVEGRIEAERASLGAPGTSGALPEVVGRYEELLVDLEFANTAYVQALGGLAAARAEARRQSRYLAPHIQPTFAQSALYPRRLLLVGLVGLFLALGWGALMLVYYNVRDNR